MRTLAASMGISDVALAKRCKAANVPVPPRGWWAKKEAGKAVKVEPLPPLPFALANYFPAYEDVPKGRDVDQSDRGKVAALPERPVFRDLAQVQAEIRAAVKSVKAPAALTTPHPIVARLLKQDAERKPASSSTYSFSTYGGPKFSPPVQQRRLRVLSCILTELARLGCKASGSTHAGERFSVSVGGFWTYIFLHVEVEPATYSYRSQRSSKRAAPEGLRFDIVDHDDRTPAKKTWREDKVPLDQQITEIIQGLLLQVEEDTRKWALLRYKWRCEDHERSVREAKLAAEKAEADRIAREEAAAAARIEALISGADALERAARIRRYVVAVRASYSEAQEAPSGLDDWTSWALAEADRIDPVVNRRFVEGLSL